MSLSLLSWLYRKLGRFYPAAFLTLELQSAFLVLAGTLTLFGFYYEGSFAQYVKVFGIAAVLTAGTIAIVLLRSYPRLRPIRHWIEGRRDRESTAQAWAAAVGAPWDLVRRDMPFPVVLVVAPTCIAAVLLLDLSWLAFFPLFAGSLIALGYSAILHYLALEAGMRPVLIDINQQAAPRTLADCSAVSLRTRLMAALPLINIITGLVVAALSSDGGGGGSDLGVDVLIAVGVATTISLELTVLLSKSILRPLADLQRATDAVREGRYDVVVPVTNADEFGELAASFNQMVEGLRERERIREAFGTYLDRDVAEFILSEGFPPEGMEANVSVLFCDVENFTQFASGAPASRVVGALNELFEVVVPIISRHGGHVDKFEGDGLLAVFGAPESFPDHADRAVRAGIEMVKRVNAGEGGALRIGVGINTGPVLAGSIGGGGRLNFSVIGDAVNVAARVEEATRQTQENVLIAPETARCLTDGFELHERGPVELKGKDEPVVLYAPELRDAAPALSSGDGHAEDLSRPPVESLGARPGPTHTLPGS